LNVETVLEATVQYADGQVRITAQLIDPDTGAHLWSGNYDRPFKDIFAIQSDIATRIAMALEAELLPAERESIERASTDSNQAYALYLKALTTLQPWNPAADLGIEAVQLADSYLSQAVVFDPAFALAYARKAKLHAERVRGSNSDEEYVALHALILENAERALALDPLLGLAHAAIGISNEVRLHGAEARVSFEKALQLSPNDPEVLIWHALFSLYAGRSQEGIPLARHATELDPNNGEYFGVLGQNLHAIGDDVAAIATLENAVSIDPTFAQAYKTLGLVEVFRGNRDRAFAHARTAERVLGPTPAPAFLAEIGYLYSRAGSREDAARVFARLEAVAADGQIVGHGAWAVAHLALGNSEEVLEWLQRAIDDRNRGLTIGGYPPFMRLIWNYFRDPLLDERRFQELRNELRAFQAG